MIFFVLRVPFRSGASNERVGQTNLSLPRATRSCAQLEAKRVINADDGAQAGSIDRYTASADDEIGYTLLAKRREKEEAVGIAWVERDECMAREVVYRARAKLEEGRMGERLRGYLHNTPTATATDVDMTAQGGREAEGNLQSTTLGGSMHSDWRQDGQPSRHEWLADWTRCR